MKHPTRLDESHSPQNDGFDCLAQWQEARFPSSLRDRILRRWTGFALRGPNHLRSLQSSSKCHWLALDAWWRTLWHQGGVNRKTREAIAVAVSVANQSSCWAESQLVSLRAAGMTETEGEQFLRAIRKAVQTENVLLLHPVLYSQGFYGRQIVLVQTAVAITCGFAIPHETATRLFASRRHLPQLIDGLTTTFVFNVLNRISCYYDSQPDWTWSPRRSWVRRLVRSLKVGRAKLQGFAHPNTSVFQHRMLQESRHDPYVPLIDSLRRLGYSELEGFWGHLNQLAESERTVSDLVTTAAWLPATADMIRGIIANGQFDLQQSKSSLPYADQLRLDQEDHAQIEHGRRDTAKGSAASENTTGKAPVALKDPAAEAEFIFRIAVVAAVQQMSTPDVNRLFSAFASSRRHTSVEDWQPTRLASRHKRPFSARR